MPTLYVERYPDTEDVRPGDVTVSGGGVYIKVATAQSDGQLWWEGATAASAYAALKFYQLLNDEPIRVVRD